MARKTILVIKQIMDAEPIVYAPLTVQEVADKLNIKDIAQQRESISGTELLSATDEAEYLNLSDVKKTQWLSLTGAESVGKNAVPIVKDIFPSVTTTWSNIIKTELVSIAEQNGLPVIRPGDVAQARAL